MPTSSAKTSPASRREVEVDLQKVMKFESEDLQLRPSDILYVPTSAAKTAADPGGRNRFGRGHRRFAVSCRVSLIVLSGLWLTTTKWFAKTGPTDRTALWI